MPEQVRVGMIGTSWWADLAHLPSLTSYSGARVVAICGRNADRAAEMAEKYAIPQVFTDYRALIERAHVDALVIATPDDTHYPITMEALSAGLHVLCEKPLALTAGQAEEMYQRAEAAGVKHMTFFTWRWLPLYQYLHYLIEDGYLGRPFHGQWSYVGDYAREKIYMWRIDQKRANGVVGDLGAHMIDLARWHMGDIVRVSAQLATCVERPGNGEQLLEPANDSASLLIQFENGAQGTLYVSAVAHVGDRVQEQHVILHGEEGTLEADVNFANMELRGARHTDTHVEPLLGPAGEWGDVSHAFSSIAMESLGDRLFVDAILQDHPVVPSF